MSRYVIEGIYWNAGDAIFIDTQNDEGGWTVVCLNDLMKDNIKENSKANCGRHSSKMTLSHTAVYSLYSFEYERH